MHITMGAEIALSLHIEAETTYTQIEGVLVDAGFTNYSIQRNVNADETSDVQIYVRRELDEFGNQQLLPATDTLENITEAIVALELATEPPA